MLTEVVTKLVSKCHISGLEYELRMLVDHVRQSLFTTIFKLPKMYAFIQIYVYILQR